MSFYGVSYSDMASNFPYVGLGLEAIGIAGGVRYLQSYKVTEDDVYGFTTKKQSQYMPPYSRKYLNKQIKKKGKKGGNKVATVAAVKRMLNKRSDIKSFTQAVVNTGVVATAGALIYSYNLTAQIIQGTTDGARIGDSINLESVSFRSFLVSGSTASTYHFRIFIVWSGEEYNPSGTAFGVGGLGPAQVFLPNAPAPNALIRIPNPKAATIIFDQTVTMHSHVAATEMSEVFAATVNLKGQKFDYQETGSSYGKTKNLYLCIIPIQTANLSAAADQVDFNTSVAVRFRDS